MAENPKFSVVIPLYNREKYITRAIEGVLAQEYKAEEIIVVDDGSTDDGAELVEKMRDSRIRLVRQANEGGAGAPARNAGMRVGCGSWFAFVDADDFWLPNHLSELAALIRDCPLAGLVATTSVELMEGQYLPRDDRPDVASGYRNYFLSAVTHTGCVHSSSAAIHRSVPLVSGVFGNASSGPDLEYWARIALDHPVALSTRRTAIYFRGNGGNMEKLAAERKSGTSTPVSEIGCLADVSPSLGLLEKRGARDRTLFQRADIRNYVNARLDQAIRTQIVRENFTQLKSLSALKFPANNKHSLTLSLVARMPPRLLRHAESLRKRLKSTVTP